MAASAPALPLKISVPAGLDTTQIDPRLAAFGLYGSQSLKLNDGVRIYPWRMGTGGNLRLGVWTLLCANTFVTGDYSLGNSSGIFGDVRLGGRYLPQAGAWDRGTIVPDASMRPMRLAFGSLNLAANTSLFVESGKRSVLQDASSYPRDVTVRANGTLVLVGESFQFRSLVLNSGAKLILQHPLAGSATSMTISVANQLLVDGAVMSGRDDAGVPAGRSTDGRAVLWKYHGSAELHLNGSTRFLGALAAPNCKVSVASKAGFQGSLWAKDVEIHQYNQNVVFLPYTGDSRYLDTDADDVPDTLEFRLGTDPLNVDTDGDGYSDGLEILGRQGYMGALKGITASGPQSRHSWGWAIDTTRRDLFNPLRRDVFLRLVWQSDAEIRQMIDVTEQVWSASKRACSTAVKYPFLKRGEFTDGWGDSAWLDRLVEIFADPSDKPLVASPHSSRVPDYTVNIHVDAGPTASRNLDPSLTRYGGEVIFATGGTNTGVGPYSFDLNGDGRFDISSHVDAVFDCQGVPHLDTTLNERDSLVAKMFHGWFADPFRDSWVLGVGYGANGRGVSHEHSEAPHHAFVTSTTSWSAIGLRAALLHEFGHTLGPGHSQPSTDLVRDGVMNYAFLGGDFQRCSPTKGATFKDTRYCGDEPLPDSLGLHNSITAEDDPRFNLSWKDKWDNLPTTLTDTLVYRDAGPLDPRTGFRKIRGTRTNADLRYSRGIYCKLDMRALNEATGISICADARGTPLPDTIHGTPIDWNQNGVIDAQPVNLWSNSGDWFLRIADSGKPLYITSWEWPESIDENDWTTMQLNCHPFIGSDPWKEPFMILLQDRGHDLMGVTSW